MENNNPETSAQNAPVSLFEWMITMLILSILINGGSTEIFSASGISI